MLKLACWLILLGANGPDSREPTDRLVPPGWRGNPWGPAATAARLSGEIPPIALTSPMKQWDRWGRKVLRDGDVLFRQGKARILWGYFPFSRFLARVDNSPFSHAGIVVIEGGEPVVYDTTKAGVRRQPFYIWVLDNERGLGVKRLRPAYRDRIPRVVAFLHRVYQEQVPFDYELDPDDRAFYCLEMAEKSFRAAGLTISEPVRLRDLERRSEFPVCIAVFRLLSLFVLDRPLSLEQRVFLPGNERHGMWASPLLEPVWPPSPARTATRGASTG